MIFRNRPYVTLKGSSLNSRGYAVPPDSQVRRASTLKGSPVLTDAPPNCGVGALSFPTFGRLPVAFQSAYLPMMPYPQVGTTYGYGKGDAFSVTCG